MSGKDEFGHCTNSNEKRPLGASVKAVTLIASLLCHFLRKVSLDKSSTWYSHYATYNNTTTTLQRSKNASLFPNYKGERRLLFTQAKLCILLRQLTFF